MQIDEILAVAELPEDTVTLCLRGALVGRWEELEHKLSGASTVALSLGEPAEASSIARDMEALRAEMGLHEVPFRLRALPALGWRKLYSRLPEPGDTDDLKASYDDRFHAWVCGVVAACCYDPAMTAEQADQLSERLSGQQWRQLSDAALNLNVERVDIPFSAAASALTRISELSLRRQEPGQSPTASGSGPKRAKPRRTSTTSKAA